MATDVGVGDSETPTLGISPFDGSTTATLTVTDPAGATSTVATSIEGDDGTTQTWVAAPVAYTTPGRWVLRWTVTGTGAGTEDRAVYVAAFPPAGGPAWGPSIAEVADHIPRLTVDTITPGSAIEHGTFTEATTPTGVQAQRHIDAAVTILGASVDPIPTGLEPLARSVAALWAAASILRAYYRDQTDLAAAAALDTRATRELKRIVDANTATTGEEYGVDVVPLHAFPPAVAWGDAYL